MKGNAELLAEQILTLDRMRRKHLIAAERLRPTIVGHLRELARLDPEGASAIGRGLSVEQAGLRE